MRALTFDNLNTVYCIGHIEAHRIENAVRNKDVVAVKVHGAFIRSNGIEQTGTVPFNVQSIWKNDNVIFIENVSSIEQGHHDLIH